MGKHNSTLNENIVITPPKAPKSFGNWLGLFECALENKIYPDKDVMFFIDDEGTEQYIKFTLLCQYVMQETAANFSNVVKLNVELTAENARLLTELEGITSDKDTAENAYNKAKGQIDYLKQSRELERSDKEGWRNLYFANEKELKSIKSKWWYKLMTWGW